MKIEQLISENKRLKEQLKDASELHAKLWANFKKQKEAIRDCKFTLDNIF